MRSLERDLRTMTISTVDMSTMSTTITGSTITLILSAVASGPRTVRAPYIWLGMRGCGGVWAVGAGGGGP